MKWNSIFYMIKRFVELRDVIKKILFEIKDKAPEPTTDELVTLKEILNLLKQLEFTAQEYMTDCENYIIVSKIIPLIG